MVEHIDPVTYIPPPVAPSGGSSGYPGQQQSPSQQRPRRAVVDIASVLSLPENVMPAAIQEAFLQLVEEVERLRDEVERVRQHEAMLLGAADRHSFLPTLNRRSFLVGLTRVLQASERADLPGTVAVIHVDGIEAIRRQFGLLAGDSALTFIAATIQSELRQTDLLGYLDASDFAIALAVAEPGGATAKIDGIVARLRSAPLMWNEHQIALEVAVGAIHFVPGMTADNALAGAAQAMISGTSALSS